MTLKPNGNTIVMSICTAIMLAAISYVGKTAAETHDSVIRLQGGYDNMRLDIDNIKVNMITKTDFENRLSMELLKLQIPATKK